MVINAHVVLHVTPCCKIIAKPCKWQRDIQDNVYGPEGRGEGGEKEDNTFYYAVHVHTELSFILYMYLCQW